MDVIKSIIAREEAINNLEYYYNCDEQGRDYYSSLGLSEESLKAGVSFWRDMVDFDIENGGLF